MSTLNITWIEWGFDDDEFPDTEEHTADTPALALCRAWLAYKGYRG